MRRWLAAAAAAATLGAGVAAPGAAGAQHPQPADGVAGLSIGGSDDRYVPYYDRGYYDRSRRHYGRSDDYGQQVYAPRYGYDWPYRDRQRCRTVTFWTPDNRQVRERRCW